jgi:hypothetical protein
LGTRSLCETLFAGRLPFAESRYECGTGENESFQNADAPKLEFGNESESAIRSRAPESIAKDCRAAIFAAVSFPLAAKMPPYNSSFASVMPTMPQVVT